jgi:hypothetical protein
MLGIAAIALVFGLVFFALVWRLLAVLVFGAVYLALGAVAAIAAMMDFVRPKRQPPQADTPVPTPPAGVSGLVPIVAGADDRHGLCPCCGGGSLRYEHSTVSGGPDLRFKSNPLRCYRCSWSGYNFEAYAAQQNVRQQLADRVNDR